MCNHTAVAKAIVKAACTLVIALLTIGICVNSSSAGSPSGLERVQTGCPGNMFPCSCGGRSPGLLRLQSDLQVLLPQRQ
jgi:hypothetical protein